MDLEKILQEEEKGRGVDTIFFWYIINSDNLIEKLKSNYDIDRHTSLQSFYVSLRISSKRNNDGSIKS